MLCFVQGAHGILERLTEAYNRRTSRFGPAACCPTRSKPRDANRLIKTFTGVSARDVDPRRRRQEAPDAAASRTLGRGLRYVNERYAALKEGGETFSRKEMRKKKAELGREFQELPPNEQAKYVEEEQEGQRDVLSTQLAGRKRRWEREEDSVQYGSFGMRDSWMPFSVASMKEAIATMGGAEGGIQKQAEAAIPLDR